MKKKILLVCKILFVIFLNSCGKDVKKVTYKFEKAGLVTLDAVDEIVLKSYYKYDPDGTLSLMPIWEIKHNINYPNNHSTGSINNPYRIGFHFNIISKNGDSSYITPGISYDLCSKEKVIYINNIDNYRGFTPLVSDKNKLHYYFAVEMMKKRGFIDDSLNSQGDICIYVKDKYIRMDDIVEFESNTIIFTKEEINNALAEYESLQ